MDYFKDSAVYYPCVDQKTTGLEHRTYYVRYKAIETHNAGAAATVNVPGAFTVPFHANVGTDVTAVQTFVADVAQDLLLNTFTCDCYIHRAGICRRMAAV